MATKNKFVIWAAIPFLYVSAVSAAEVSTNIAQMQAMDKITGRVSMIEVPVNGEVRFESFSVVVRECKTRTAEEIPESFAFVDVADKDFDGKEINIFKGWMISSSPSLNAVEHPIYDVWLIKCINGNVNKKSLLSVEKLKERDELPMREIEKSKEEAREDTLVVSEPAAEELVPVEGEVLIEETAVEVPIENSKTTEEVVVGGEGGPQSLINFDSTEEFSVTEGAEETTPEASGTSFLDLDDSEIKPETTDEMFRFDGTNKE